MDTFIVRVFRVDNSTPDSTLRGTVEHPGGPQQAFHSADQLIAVLVGADGELQWPGKEDGSTPSSAIREA